MTLQMPDSAPVPLKYLSYWVRKPEGWRVVVYRRRRHAEPPPSAELMPAALPPRIVAPTTNGSIIAMYRASLDREERAFSDSAQVIGLGPAFVKFGSADAINLGDFNTSTFIVGSEAIGRAIGAGAPGNGSPVRWAPDTVLVASSGDLGVTIGFLRPNATPPAAPIPFFTIWRRETTADRWLYVMAVACQPQRRGAETAPRDPRSPPFVGWVTSTNGQFISIDEDVPSKRRQAEVMLMPSTEIVGRSGLLASAQQLRPGVRVTVWFTGNATETDRGVVRATALRVQIDQ
jgi:hypothetical protein